MEFTTPDILVENPIPEETRIYYSKTKLLITIVLSIFILCLGLYILTLGVDYLAGSLLCFVAGGAFLYFKYTTFIDSRPQIIINSNGLQIVDHSFYKWNDIKKADVTKLEIRKTTYYHFTYQTTTDDSETSIRIDNFNISEKNLRLLLHYYKEKNKNPNYTYLNIRDFKYSI